MKATAWLCPVLTLLCATKLVYTAQRGSYGNYHPAMDGLDSNALQNDYFLSKRNKPSLSIVNPLDVLRQRLLLEIARRQMKENTRQVELNRAILKNVGKRMFSKRPYPLASPSKQWEALGVHEPQQQQQQHNGNMQREPMHLQPYDLELIPSTLIFDYPQRRRPWLPYDRTELSYDNYDIETDNDENDGDDDGVGGGDVDNGMEDVKLALQPLAGQSDEHHETTLKKPINRSGHEGAANDANSLLSSLKHHKAFNNDFKLNDLTTMDLNEASSGNKNSKNNSDNDDYQVQRYLYHLHKNHLTRK